MAESEGRTVLRTFCSECALSPRAPRASVELVGGGGFPVHLSGCCPQFVLYRNKNATRCNPPLEQPFSVGPYLSASLQKTSHPYTLETYGLAPPKFPFWKSDGARRFQRAGMKMSFSVLKLSSS